MSCIKIILIPFCFFEYLLWKHTEMERVERHSGCVSPSQAMPLLAHLSGSTSYWEIQMVLYSCEFTNANVQLYALFLTSKATSQCSCPDKSARLFPLCTFSSSTTCFASHSHLWAQRAAQPTSRCYKGTPPHKLKDLSDMCGFKALFKPALALMVSFHASQAR